MTGPPGRMPKVERPGPDGRKGITKGARWRWRVRWAAPPLPLPGAVSRKVDRPLLKSSVDVVGVDVAFNFSAALQFGWPTPAVAPVARCCVQLVKLMPLLLKA